MDCHAVKYTKKQVASDSPYDRLHGSTTVIPRVLCCLLCSLSGCLEKVESPATSDPNAAAASSVRVSEVTTSGGVPMILVTGGEFTMGSDSGNPDEQPLHRVRLSPFVMDKFEVTQDQYAQLQLPNPAHFKGDRRPVEQVRWSDAALFCNERSRAEGLEPCYDEVTFACDFDASGYRLPTEAEWEFAARAGLDETGDGDIKLDQKACYAANSGDQTQPVGERRPNAWGFCDMQGNVSEWCNDIYAADYYTVSGEMDPHGPEEGKQRVLRGGNWKSPSDDCRLTARIADDPGISDACFARDTFGFRCVRKPLPAENGADASSENASTPNAE